MKWMFIIVLAALSLNGCADTADAETSAAITPVENQEGTTTVSYTHLTLPTNREV